MSPDTTGQSIPANTSHVSFRTFIHSWNLFSSVGLCTDIPGRLLVCPFQHGVPMWDTRKQKIGSLIEWKQDTRGMFSLDPSGSTILTQAPTSKFFYSQTHCGLRG